MNTDIRTTKDLFEHLVYFSHINKQTQYERPTFGTYNNKINGINGNHTNGITGNGNSHHFSGASSSNFVNGNTNGWNSSSTSVQQQPMYNTRPPHHFHHQQQQPSQKQHLQQNGIIKNSHHQHPPPQHPQSQRISPRGTMGYSFTSDISELRGELITTRVQKGPKGLGFTLIGNDGTSAQPEFIQVIL